MKNLQKGFAIIPLVIVLALLVIGGGTYIVLQNKVSQNDNSGAQNVPITTDNSQNTVTNPSNNNLVFVGTKKTFLPEKIVSIDPNNKTFVVNYESRQAPFTIPTEFSVVSETTIKKENSILNFSNLAVNDVVWIRAYEKGEDEYVAKNVIITNDWRSSQVIIKKIEIGQNKITAEVFLPPHRRGEQTILAIIPETEVRKGKAEEGESRKVVGLNNLAVGDIASVVEVGFGVHPADDKGPFYATEIDVVSPYYCEQYLKPTGCIEREQGQSSNTLPVATFSITSINGPKSLTNGQAGTWSVVAPNASRFAVIWADGTPVKVGEGSGIPYDSEFKTSPSFTHAFSKPGTYYVQFFAKILDGKGTLDGQGFEVNVQ